MEKNKFFEIKEKKQKKKELNFNKECFKNKKKFVY